MTVDGRPRPAGGEPATVRRGRHARPDRRTEPPTPPSGHAPRHAAPDAPTEQIVGLPSTGPAAPPTTPVLAPAQASPPPLSPPGGMAPVVAPAPAREPATPGPISTGPATPIPATPVPATPIPAAAATAEAARKKPLYGFAQALAPGAPVPSRVRVVLSERRSPTRAVRTVAEIEQQTETGEFLLSNLMRAQLALGVRLGIVALLVLGALPLLFVVAPTLSGVLVLGIRLPWLLLGLAPYPFLLGLAHLYTRHAERNELDFADNVED